MLIDTNELLKNIPNFELPGDTVEACELRCIMAGLRKYKGLEREEDFGTICVCAVRYSLGRMTYMPELVQGFVIANIGSINDNAIYVMVRDIEEHGGMGADFDSKRRSYGSEHDYQQWMIFKQFLADEYKKRKEDKT